MAAVNLHFSRCTALLQLLSCTGLNDGVGEISGLLLNTRVWWWWLTLLRDHVGVVARLRSNAPCQALPCTIACNINDHQLVHAAPLSDAPPHPQSLSSAYLSFSSQNALLCCALEVHLSLIFCCVLVWYFFVFVFGIAAPIWPPVVLPLECWRPALCHGWYRGVAEYWRGEPIIIFYSCLNFSLLFALFLFLFVFPPHIKTLSWM